MKKEPNITQLHADIFNEMSVGLKNYALLSVFFDGEPTAAIVRCERKPDNEEEMIVRLVAIMVTDAMADKTRDHDGVAPSQR
jgi:hypothetical protein